MNRNTLILIVLVISSVVKAQDWDQPLLTGVSDAPKYFFSVLTSKSGIR